MHKERLPFFWVLMWLYVDVVPDAMAAFWNHAVMDWGVTQEEKQPAKDGIAGSY